MKIVSGVIKMNSNTTLEELDLSVRAYNCLKRHRINTLGQLEKLTHEDLLKVRNMNMKCVFEVEKKLGRVDEIVEHSPLEFKPNEIVFDRKRGWYGIYLSKVDSECSEVQFEDGLTIVRTKWLTHVNQVAVLKIIREYNELQQRGVIDLGNEFEY
jgi:hypothetical protein